MHQSNDDPLLSLREAARQLGIDHSTLSRQIAAGQVRSHKGKVRLSEIRADRASNLNQGRVGRRKKRRIAGASRGAAPPGARGASDASSRPDDAISGETYAEALRRKEVALADLREQELANKARALIDRAAAERLFFETAREFRDAWIAWPARVATMMASEVGIEPTTGKVDARSLAGVLSAHVLQHLAEMGEQPSPEWSASS